MKRAPTILAALALAIVLPAAAADDKPAAAKAAPAKKAAAKAPAAPKAAPAQSRSTLPVGALDSAPDRKFGEQKPPCVYKPVMTAEDLENCR